MATVRPAVAIITFTAKQGWLDLARDERTAWLRDRIAALREAGFGDDSRLAWSKFIAPDIVTVWLVGTQTARDVLVDQLGREDLKQYFQVGTISEALADDDDAAIAPFLDIG